MLYLDKVSKLITSSFLCLLHDFQFYWKNRCLWNTHAPFPNKSRMTLTFDLNLSLTDLNIDCYSSRTICLQSLNFLGKAFLSFQWHKVWVTNITFDLDLWPTDLNISRDHLLIKDYPHSSQVWSFWGKAFLSYQLHKIKIPTYWQTNRHVQSNMPLHLLRRRAKISTLVSDNKNHE